MAPIKGIRAATSATGSPSCPLNADGSIIPVARMENESAKIRTLRTSPIVVRGMMVAGRRVSWATCEIDSRPTNEMIASDVPNANCPSVGRLKTS